MGLDLVGQYNASTDEDTFRFRILSWKTASIDSKAIKVSK